MEDQFHISRTPERSSVCIAETPCKTQHRITVRQNFRIKGRKPWTYPVEQSRIIEGESRDRAKRPRSFVILGKFLSLKRPAARRDPGTLSEVDTVKGNTAPSPLISAAAEPAQPGTGQFNAPGNPSDIAVIKCLRIRVEREATALNDGHAKRCSDQRMSNCDPGCACADNAQISFYPAAVRRTAKIAYHRRSSLWPVSLSALLSRSFSAVF